MRYENLVLIYLVTTIAAILVTAIIFSERQSYLFLGSLSNLVIAAVSLKAKVKRKFLTIVLLTIITLILITLIIVL